MRGAGCSRCDGSGFQGRRGVFEVVDVTPALRRVLLENPGESALVEAARSGGTVSLREAAVTLAAAGLTTLDEAVRVTVHQVDG
jgi:type II secretory ATPase GspE/PulE/Tfp pilus assembly ATPase PilB-like protein